MQSLNLNTLSSNAWRTLGLPATATQQDLDLAARKMAIWPDPAHIPPTPWDFPNYGPLSRTKNDLSQALARLNQPQSRVYERLLWFQCPMTADYSTRVDELGVAWANAPDPAGRHDAALASLHDALAHDPNMSDERCWRNAIGGFARLAESDEYRRWLHRVETDGDFEKRAEADEIDLALFSIPEMIAGSLVLKANEALDDGDIARCGRIFRLLLDLRKVELQQQLLNRIEDALDRNCRLLHDETGRQLICDHNNFHANMLANGRVALQQAHFFNDTISPLQVLTQSRAEAVDDHDRSVRGRDLAASALAKVALAWVWSGKYAGADQTFDAALSLAAGPSLIATIRASKEENLGRAVRELQRASQPKTVAGRITSRSMGFRSTGVVIVIIVAIIRLAALTSHSSRTYSPPLTPMPAMPSFEPPQIPRFDDDFLRRLSTLPSHETSTTQDTGANVDDPISWCISCAWSDDQASGIAAYDSRRERGKRGPGFFPRPIDDPLT